jgi:SAM-dependent methyltransferase
MRRLADSNYVRRYLVGEGVDIGGKPDPLALYAELFPQITAIKTWDLEDGDAQFMHGVADDSLDFVFSSHCLEHINDPHEALVNWMRILKPGGHLIVAVPDEDMYEQGVWPSSHNLGHRHSFTMFKANSWCPASINLFDMIRTLGPAADLRKLEALDQSFRFDLPRFDQTLSPIGECGIEFVIRKRTAAEIAMGGRLPKQDQPSPQLRVYLNQYRNDQRVLKRFAADRAPFTDETEL